jgi:hypothetical protein
LAESVDTRHILNSFLKIHQGFQEMCPAVSGLADAKGGFATRQKNFWSSAMTDEEMPVIRG